MSGNPQAFPTSSINPGMTLRDWFAGQALSGFMADPSNNIHRNAPTPEEACANTALAAYNLADAMVAERAKAGAK